MKIKILVLIGIIFLTNSIVLADTTYKKQINAEYELNKKISQTFENNKTLPYKLILMDDFLKSYLSKDRKTPHGVLNRILSIKNHYQNDINSYNYAYCVKAEELYGELVDKAIITRENYNQQSLDMADKKILISDNLYNKLDKDLVYIITLLNVFAENL